MLPTASGAALAVMRGAISTICRAAARSTPSSPLLLHTSQPPSITAAFSTASSSATPYPRGIIEVREYTLTPQGMADWMKLTEETAALRKELLPIMGMFTADISPCLHKVTHYYHYKDFDDRDAVRGRAAKTPAWVQYVKAVRPYVQHQENKILLEAGPVYEALGLPHTRDYRSPPAPSPSTIYEQRSYQLHPGYGSVPKLIEAFRKGLPDKVASDPEGQLVLFGYTDVGMLNNVVELWRYPSAQACIKARQAARQVPTWREAIGAVTPGVQHFTSSFLKPMRLSPWQ